jgi:ankyrin repeat protein
MQHLYYMVLLLIALCRVSNSFHVSHSTNGKYLDRRLRIHRSTCGTTQTGGSATLSGTPVIGSHRGITDAALENTKKTTQQFVDNRPHARRTSAPRKARRLNHSFQHLYRHFNSTNHHADPILFLAEQGGYSLDEVLEMNRTFPPLLDLDVQRHLQPKLLFLKYTLQQSEALPLSSKKKVMGKEILSPETRKILPPQYFGARLERTIAPRHAFLMYKNLPHGTVLLKALEQNTNDADESSSVTDRPPSLLSEFMISSRKIKQFCALCNNWRRKYGAMSSNGSGITTIDQHNISPKEVEAFDAIFQRGLMAAARNEIDPSNQYIKYINITSGDMIRLLVNHGANPLERDVRGVSLIHWAAGAGNLQGLNALIDMWPETSSSCNNLTATRDGATPLHWAAAGAKAKEFGSGGHEHICQYLLTVSNCNARQLVNQLTKDGNSVLMWAAWSGTLPVVKLLIRHQADSTVANRNGCTVAHWAVSGGNLEVCKYLAEVVGVDFTIPNCAGNTPLSHAVAYSRVDIIQWLQNDLGVQDEGGQASDLAWDFVGWLEGDKKRKQIFDLFQSDWDEIPEEVNDNI